MYLNEHVSHHVKKFSFDQTDACFEFSYDKLVKNVDYTIHNEMMPGFRVNWFFTIDGKPITLSSEGSLYGLAWTKSDSSWNSDYAWSKATATGYRR